MYPEGVPIIYIVDTHTRFQNAAVLRGKSPNDIWLSLSSYKCRRIVRSVFGGGTYAFADGFDVSFSLKHDIGKIVGRNVLLTMLTYSESLF